jgi:tetratricopeptide (TPR) repeat protein
MGAVYAAEHIDLERPVAIKVVRSDVAPAPSTVARFRDEARAASKVGSQFICDVTDFGQTPDGRVFFVMEYLAGVSLARLLREGGRLPVPRALAILRQIAKALQAAHAKGIVHLDIKPDNVMLVARGKRADAVKVVDFGIAQLLHADRKDEKISGTPEYMAPERFIGLGYDHRADVYSMGVLAYEMLSGVVPIQGPTFLATLTMQVNERPLPLGKRAPEAHIPEQLTALVMQMLEKDPGSRPHSMAIVEAMLCEAQIAAGVRTGWDDLELPEVDQAWQKKLGARMPAPWGKQKTALVVGALGLAIAGSGLALYFGVLREPEVVVKYVDVTKSEEATAVAEWLEKAVQAAKAQRYIRPEDQSALAFIQRAEAEHAALPGKEQSKSKGAENLRRMYASALAVVGDELLKANLRDLAALKFKEALLFTPDDPTLQAKADLSPEERGSLRERSRAVAARPGQARNATAGDEAKEVAASLFLAARQGRFSQARVALKSLAAVDEDGVQAAKLADAFRQRADELWGRGDRAAARPLFQLVGELDPQDLEAKRRAQADPAPPPAPAPAAAPASALAAAAPAPARALAAAASASAPAKSRKRSAEVRDDLSDAPRNPTASKAAAAEGLAALRRLQLAEAETAFNRALKADSTNVVAVAGLAEVAFERSRYTEALDYARKAARLAPKNPQYLLLLGDAHFKLLRYGEAQTAYEKAKALVPDDPVVANRLQRVKLKLRE